MGWAVITVGNGVYTGLILVLLAVVVVVIGVGIAVIVAVTVTGVVRPITNGDNCGDGIRAGRHA